ncbi:Snf7 family protein [Babesia bovis T2Bo]|uniref:SNF7 family protein n=1 Tax=Babesia bovis TaxID=5865 RepID=A7AMT2_BABBO|nr:Snf7 family protein [Babesia bovis T2Bo]EDO07866.1 Snf7 family protein [Babesia bovis T2Bo]|eukprot:XP_001611434.1 hypothetical protein [Babesia bovis T2Bo]
MVFSLLRRSKRSAIREPSSSNKHDVESALELGKKAIQDMNQHLLILDERIKGCIAEAKERYSKNDKAGALGALRRKKLYEEEASRVTSSIMTLETQNITLEGAQMQQVALNALTTGAAAHKRFQDCMAANAVDDLMEQLEEQRETQYEIYDSMTQGVTLATEFEDELEALMRDEQVEQVAVGNSLAEIEAELLAEEAQGKQKTAVSAVNKTTIQTSAPSPIAQ